MFPESIKGLKRRGRLQLVAEDLGRQGRLRLPRSTASPRSSTEAKAKIKDLDSLKATVPAIGKECGGCHETFRLKNG